MRDDAMRVLCLTSWYPPHHFGGYELSCHDVMHRLADRGSHVEVLTSDYRHEDVPDEDPSPVAAVHRRLSLYFRDGDLWSPSPLGRLRVERHNHRALDAVLRSSRPDVVSVWHVGAMSLGLISAVRRHGIPMVFAISDDWTIYAPTLDPWTRATSRWPRLAPVIEAVTGVPSGLPDLDDVGPACFISEVTRRRSEEKSPWRFRTNGLVYSAIDYELFRNTDDEKLEALRPSAEPAPAHGRGDAVRLLYVGRVDARKGIHTLVRALKLLPEATLTIDGRASESDRGTLESWIHDEGVADRVTISCSARSDLPAQYRAADICVFPSEWEEPFGLVPLESMASATPVVATGVGGSGEFLVDGDNCVLYPPGDEVALADAVRRLCGDHLLRQRLVRQGQRTAEHFDASYLADAFDRWHRVAVGCTADAIPGDRPLPHRAAEW